MKQSYPFLLFFSLLLGFERQAQGQDSLFINYEQAQQRLIEQNLQLVAAKYEVDIAQAQVVQAKLWTNPYLIWNQDLYSVERNQYFNASNQHLIQIEQTFSISGKHVNSVRLAKINVEINKLIVADIMRGLLMELAIQYSELQAAQTQARIYQTMLKQFETVIQNAEQQLKLGALAGNELTRLRTEYVEMQQAELQLRVAMEQAMSQIRILLALPNNVYINASPRALPLATNFQPATLLDLAKDLRPDYQLKKQEIAYEKQNLKLQKSNAIPDVKLAYQPRDRGSNYVRPYTGFNFEMSVPIFNRNQGNIKEAAARSKQKEASLQLFENELNQQIITAFNQFSLQKQGLNRYNNEFLAELETLQKNAQTSYNNRNISLLEYIDLQRIYLQTQLQQAEMQNSYMQAINQLNFEVGKDIIE